MGLIFDICQGENNASKAQSSVGLWGVCLESGSSEQCIVVSTFYGVLEVSAVELEDDGHLPLEQ